MSNMCVIICIRRADNAFLGPKVLYACQKIQKVTWLTTSTACNPADSLNINEQGSL